MSRDSGSRIFHEGGGFCLQRVRIPATPDRYLTAPAEITIFGRATLALGYPNSAAAFAATHDVDAIFPLSWLEAPQSESGFWGYRKKQLEHAEPATDWCQ